MNDNFLKSVREKITEGSSAVFLLLGDTTTGKVAQALKQLPRFRLIGRT
jgi:uncharacterized membrane protein